MADIADDTESCVDEFGCRVPVDVVQLVRQLIHSLVQQLEEFVNKGKVQCLPAEDFTVKRPEANVCRVTWQTLMGCQLAQNDEGPFYYLTAPGLKYKFYRNYIPINKFLVESSTTLFLGFSGLDEAIGCKWKKLKSDRCCHLVSIWWFCTFIAKRFIRSNPTQKKLYRTR